MPRKLPLNTTLLKKEWHEALLYFSTHPIAFSHRAEKIECITPLQYFILNAPALWVKTLLNPTIKTQLINDHNLLVWVIYRAFFRHETSLEDLQTTFLPLIHSIFDTPDVKLDGLAVITTPARFPVGESDAEKYFRIEHSAVGLLALRAQPLEFPVAPIKLDEVEKKIREIAHALHHELFELIKERAFKEEINGYFDEFPPETASVFRDTDMTRGDATLLLDPCKK